MLINSNFLYLCTVYLGVKMTKKHDFDEQNVIISATNSSTVRGFPVIPEIVTHS